MKILQLIPNISGGGAERFVVDLSNELAKTHEVTLLTLYDKREKDLFREELAPEIEIESLGKQVGFDRKIIPKLYKAIKRIAPDVIHNHLRTFNYLMPVIPFLKRVPIVHTVHSDAYKECPNPKIRRSRKQFFKRNIIMPVTISKESKNSFTKAYNGMSSKLIYNGRACLEKSNQYLTVAKNIEKLKTDNKTRVFVHIGRIAGEKNQLMLTNAINRLVDEDGANAILLILGGGRDTNESRDIQEKLHQAEQEHPHIHLMGEQLNATDYLFVADFFCLSSIYEGMPITLIEAFATGTIPISTSVGGITEMISELDDSLLSKKVDINSYYEALKRAYFLSEEKKQLLGTQAQQLFAEKYSIEFCSIQYLNLYRKLI